jgi:heme/copper-type cytochrome/quinol oxidase subunit 4
VHIKIGPVLLHTKIPLEKIIIVTNQFRTSVSNHIQRKYCVGYVLKVDMTLLAVYILYQNSFKEIIFIIYGTE